jgi:hypothetical protein
MWDAILEMLGSNIKELAKLNVRKKSRDIVGSFYSISCGLSSSLYDSLLQICNYGEFYLYPDVNSIPHGSIITFTRNTPNIPIELPDTLYLDRFLLANLDLCKTIQQRILDLNFQVENLEKIRNRFNNDHIQIIEDTGIFLLRFKNYTTLVDQLHTFRSRLIAQVEDIESRIKQNKFEARTAFDIPELQMCRFM